MLEICVASLASARAACRGGAQRLELCAGLEVGGLTPDVELLRQIREEMDIPVRCLMRPRGGDFLYTPEEIELMARQIRNLAAAGAEGFVIGCLTPDGDLDKEAMAPLLEAARGYGLTLHRCIDVSRDPIATYKTAGELGIDTVLTSGAASTAMGGLDTIEKLLEVRRTQGGPQILIASNVRASVIEAIQARCPDADAFHTSAKTEIESAMVFRRHEVPMGLPGLDEWHIQQTNEDVVREAAQVLGIL